MNKSTKTTSKPFAIASVPVQSSYGVESWRQAKPLAFIETPQRPPELKQYFDALWPAIEMYDSVMKPIFLADLPSAAAANPNTEWLVRDGLLPLIWFFTKNPEPGSFRGKLRVHADFEEFIPDAWRPQVDLYELFSGDQDGYESSLETETSEIKELLLTGLIMQSYCSLSKLESDLKGIVELIGGPRKVSKVKIRAFMPHRYEMDGTHGAVSFFNRYMQLVCQYLGTDIEFMEYEGLRWLYPNKGTWIHEFNEKWLVADSYLTLLGLSKRARYLNLNLTNQNSPSAKSSATKFDRIYSIYPHVSCHVRSRYSKPFINFLTESWVAQSQERAELYFRAMNSSANFNYPWPGWFDSWCKEVISEKSVRPL